MRIQDLLAEQLDGTRQWTLKLLADVKGDDWSFQPGPGMGHALWMCGHLAASQNTLIHVRGLGRGILPDGFVQHFPIGAPVAPADKHRYPTASEVLAVMADVHARTLEAVRGMSDALLAEPAFAGDGKPHPHYHNRLGLITHCNRHEAFHAGQIATLRRLMGKSFLR